MAKTSNLVVRLEPEIKEKAEAIFKKMGISASTAVDMFYRQVIVCLLYTSDAADE